MNPELKHHFEQKGLQFVGQDVEGERMEVIELEGMGKACLKSSTHRLLLIHTILEHDVEKSCLTPNCPSLWYQTFNLCCLKEAWGSRNMCSNTQFFGFRPLLLCWSAVSSRVHLQTYQTFSSILWSPAGLCRKTPELPGQGLSPFSTVNTSTSITYQSKSYLKEIKLQWWQSNSFEV